MECSYLSPVLQNTAQIAAPQLSYQITPLPDSAAISCSL
jgi:hypothetical protein